MLYPRSLLTVRNILVSASPFLVSVPFTVNEISKFEDSEDKALWQPPGYVFGIVWPLIYASLFYMNWNILQSTTLIKSLKNTVMYDTLIESGLQGLWLYNFRYKPEIKGRNKDQYFYGLITIFALLGFGLYRLNTFILNPEAWEYTKYYIPYLLWITFATLLNMQLYTGVIKQK